MTLTDVMLAENVLSDPNGRLTLFSLITGGVQTLALPGLLRRLAVATRWESPIPLRCRVALYAPDGTLLADADADIPTGPFWQLTLFSDVPLPVEGEYKLTVFAGSNVEREIPLTVTVAPPPAGTAANLNREETNATTNA